MSKSLTVRVVCEGPTDFTVIRSMIQALGVDAVVTPIQPEDNGNLLGHAGELGGGWKGVKRWCQEAAGPVLRITRANADVVVIHCDADIAAEPEHDCVRPCPPASSTADEVRQLIQGWLGLHPLPKEITLCVPAWATEAWVFWALFPTAPQIAGLECRINPAALLVPKTPKLVAKKAGRYRKLVAEYRRASTDMRGAWSRMRPPRPDELERFLGELKAKLL